MKSKEPKVISIRLIYVIFFLVLIIVGITIGVEHANAQKSKTAVENDLGIVEQEETQVATSRQETSTVTTRSEESTRSQTNSENDENNNDSNEEEEINEENQNTEQVTEEVTTAEEIETTNYVSISEVKISQNMDLTVRTGLSREDFIKLISGVKQDTSGFFEQNAGTIYDLCEEYSLNEIFFCGIISAESGWSIAQNHRNTHNYISLMSNGSLISYSSVESGLREAARVLHTNYLTPGGKYYYGKTLSAVKTKFCPSSSTWVSLVYGRMSQILK